MCAGDQVEWNIVGGFKLFYHAVSRKRNEVGVILLEECVNSVTEVKRFSKCPKG